MSEPRPWGGWKMDDETEREFVVVLPETTVRAAADLVKQHASPRFAYLVVPRPNGVFAVIRWVELEQHAAPIGYGVLDRSLSQVLQSWPSVESIERGKISHQQALLKRGDQDGERLVVVEGGVVVGVFVPSFRSGEGEGRIDLLDPPVSTPSVLSPEHDLGVLSLNEGVAAQATPPAERRINIWIDGDKGLAAHPLAVGTRYILHLDVNLPRANSVAGSDLFSEIPKEFVQEGQTTVEMTFVLQAPKTQLQILGPRDFTITVPVEAGPSEFEALFQVRPLVTGDVPLVVYAMINDQLFQQIEFSLAVAMTEAQPIPEFPDTPPRVTVSGYTMGSIAALPARANPLSLVITPTPDGYDLLLIGGVTMYASTSLTEDAVAERIHEARNALKEVVYLKDEGELLYQTGWQIPPEVHTQTLAKLAEAGRVLFEDLFFYDGLESSAAAMGRRIQEISRTRSLNISVVGRNFIFPWTLVYDRPVGEPVDAKGFWGFNHIIQHLPNSGTPGLSAFDPVISAKDGLRVAFVFNEGIDAQMKRPLIADQRAFFGTLGRAVVAEHKSEDELLALLNNPQSDAQVVYIYCHAESYQPGQTNKLGVQQGASDSRLILTQGTQGIKVRELERRASRTIQMGGAPIVFLNACQGAAMSPLLYQGLVPFFIRKGARGVLGTEVDTPALFAAEFAKRFFTRFATSGRTMGELLLELRQEFLREHNNVMPLVYSLYSDGDILVRPE